MQLDVFVFNDLFSSFESFQQQMLTNCFEVTFLFGNKINLFFFAIECCQNEEHLGVDDVQPFY